MQIVFEDENKSYTLSTHPNNHCDYWIATEDGEGMCITEQQIVELFNEYFKANF